MVVLVVQSPTRVSFGETPSFEREKNGKKAKSEREREKSLNRDARITDFFIFEQRDREKKLCYFQMHGIGIS